MSILLKLFFCFRKGPESELFWQLGFFVEITPSRNYIYHKPKERIGCFYELECLKQLFAEFTLSQVIPAAFIKLYGNDVGRASRQGLGLGWPRWTWWPSMASRHWETQMGSLQSWVVDTCCWPWFGEGWYSCVHSPWQVTILCEDFP
jgi:hypothetical protein